MTRTEKRRKPGEIAKLIGTTQKEGSFFHRKRAEQRLIGLLKSTIRGFKAWKNNNWTSIVGWEAVGAQTHRVPKCLNITDTIEQSKNQVLYCRDTERRLRYPLMILAPNKKDTRHKLNKRPSSQGNYWMYPVQTSELQNIYLLRCVRNRTDSDLT